MIYARIQSDLVEGQEKDSKSPASNCQESIPSRCSLNPNSLVNKSCAKKRICLGEGHADAFSNVARNIYFRRIKSLHIRTYQNLLSSPVTVGSYLPFLQPNTTPLAFGGEIQAGGRRELPGDPQAPRQGMSDAIAGRGLGAAPQPPSGLPTPNPPPPPPGGSAPPRQPAGKRTPPSNGPGRLQPPGAGVWQGKRQHPEHLLPLLPGGAGGGAGGQAPSRPAARSTVRIPASPLPAGPCSLPCPRDRGSQELPGAGYLCLAHGHPCSQPRCTPGAGVELL